MHSAVFREFSTMHGILAEIVLPLSQTVRMHLKNVIQTSRNMSLGSEHNVNSLYAEQLPFEQPHEALGGEESFTINNCFSRLSGSLPATALGVPGGDIHRHTCQNLGCSGRINIWSRPTLSFITLSSPMSRPQHTPQGQSALEGKQVAWAPQELTPNHRLRHSHLSLAGTPYS